MDLVGICLLVVLGASIAYLLDAIFHFTGRIEDWLSDRLNQ